MIGVLEIIVFLGTLGMVFYAMALTVRARRLKISARRHRFEKATSLLAIAIQKDDEREIESILISYDDVLSNDQKELAKGRLTMLLIRE